MSIYKVLAEANVAPVLETWLAEEIVESDLGPNKYLSGKPSEIAPDMSFETTVSQLYLPFEDDNNFLAQKVKSHQSRILNWLTTYKEMPDSRTNDEFTARIGFNSLMTISGSYRKQCLLMAGSEEEYIHLRHEQGPTGINIADFVEAELARKIPELDDPDPEVRIDYIVDRTTQTTENNVWLQRSIHEWAAAHRKPAGQPIADGESSPVVAMLVAQGLYVGLEVAQMAVAASFRDYDPTKIPFLHPMNITDNKGVIYPLAA